MPILINRKDVVNLLGIFLPVLRVVAAVFAHGKTQQKIIRSEG